MFVSLDNLQQENDNFLQNFSTYSNFVSYRWSKLAYWHRFKEKKTPSLSNQARFAPFTLKVAWSGKSFITCISPFSHLLFDHLVLYLLSFWVSSTGAAPACPPPPTPHPPTRTWEGRLCTVWPQLGSRSSQVVTFWPVCSPGDHTVLNERRKKTVRVCTWKHYISVLSVSALYWLRAGYEQYDRMSYSKLASSVRAIRLIWFEWVGGINIPLVSPDRVPTQFCFFKFPLFSCFSLTDARFTRLDIKRKMSSCNFSDFRMFHMLNWVGRHIQFVTNKCKILQQIKQYLDL